MGGVSDDRVSQVLEVAANLMPSSGFRLRLDQGHPGGRGSGSTGTSSCRRGQALKAGHRILWQHIVRSIVWFQGVIDPHLGRPPSYQAR